jgi:RNA polymerase sigma-32 factor
MPKRKKTSYFVQDDHAEEPVQPAAASVPAVFDPFRKYLHEANKYPLLTEEEERRLTRDYRKTLDPAIARKLVLSNLRLVIKIAMEYYYKVFSNISDLIQEGNIGLLLSVKKYNPDKGIRFPSYAQFWIRAYILKHLLNSYSMVKIGTTRKQKKVFYNLAKAKEALENLGFKSEPALLAKYMDVSDNDVKLIERRMKNRDVSLDAPVESGSTTTVQETIVQQPRFERDVEKQDMLARVREKMKDFYEDLGEKERYIWDHRLLPDGPQMTLQDIAAKFKISKERIRQIEERIVRNLKKYWSKNVTDISINDILSTS